MVTITDSARDYLAGLLDKQQVDGMAVRMFVTQPGTPRAETCLAYCKPDEVIGDDEIMDLEQFIVYLDARSLPYLEEALVDFNPERMGGQLTIKAPNAKMPRVGPDASLEERITYTLVTEVNPGLAAHGGEVSLVGVVEDSIAVLRFGGGCQGCSAVDLTLKGGVEKTLMETFPELTGVRDETDHSVKDNAYYS